MVSEVMLLWNLVPSFGIDDVAVSREGMEVQVLEIGAVQDFALLVFKVIVSIRVAQDPLDVLVVRVD